MLQCLSNSLIVSIHWEIYAESLEVLPHKIIAISEVFLLSNLGAKLDGPPTQRNGKGIKFEFGILKEMEKV